jgi:arylsulfatase A-like enzyme
MDLSSKTGRALVLAGLAAGLCLASPARAGEVAPKRPNVVLILTDDMGWADLGCYGARDIRTPNIDRLAKEGVRLTDFYSNGPVCTPTRAALMTGRWQQRVGLEWAIPPGVKKPGLPASETSLARMLKDAGYKTGLCGKWHLGYRKEFAPNAHGFDSFYGLLSGNVDHYAHRENNGELDWYENTKPLEVKGYSTDLITERAVDFIDKNARSPFFLYLAYNAAHWPFQPPGRPDVRKKENWLAGTRKDYAAMVERVDWGVGKVLGALEKHHLTKDTLVIFTNDNGGERLSDNGPFFHRKGTLWEGGIRVFCLIRWPGGKVPAGKVSKQPAITMDLTATILAACRVKPPAGRKLDGVDLLPLLGRDRVTERTFFWRILRGDRLQKAVRQGDWKYVRDGGWVLLFNLADDPGERRDLYRKYPEKTNALRKALVAWEKEMAREKPLFQVR